MANNFCQNCGTKNLAEAKFCAACGQAQTVSATAATEGSPKATTPAAGLSKKTVFIAAGAAIIAVAIAVVFFMVKPNSSVSFNGKSAGEIVDLLEEAGYCQSTENDNFTVNFEYCSTSDPYGVDVNAQVSPSDLVSIGNANTWNGGRFAYGNDWVVIVHDESDLIEKITNKFGGKIGSK